MRELRLNNSRGRNLILLLLRIIWISSELVPILFALNMTELEFVETETVLLGAASLGAIVRLLSTTNLDKSSIAGGMYVKFSELQNQVGANQLVVQMIT